MIIFMFFVTIFVILFFFFQAEDGIRDIGVTGVQTCALPICCWGGTSPGPRTTAGDPVSGRFAFPRTTKLFGVRRIELRDEAAGLDALIVIDHGLFPVSAGGTRMLPDVDAREVARLARAM